MSFYLSPDRQTVLAVTKIISSETRTKKMSVTLRSFSETEIPRNPQAVATKVPKATTQP